MLDTKGSHNSMTPKAQPDVAQLKQAWIVVIMQFHREPTFLSQDQPSFASHLRWHLLVDCLDTGRA